MYFLSGAPTLGGAGGARVALHTEFLQFLLSFEGGYSGISDSLLQKNFSGSKPPDPQTATLLFWKIVVRPKSIPVEEHTYT